MGHILPRLKHRNNSRPLDSRMSPQILCNRPQVPNYHSIHGLSANQIGSQFLSVNCPGDLNQTPKVFQSESSFNMCLQNEHAYGSGQNVLPNFGTSSVNRSVVPAHLGNVSPSVLPQFNSTSTFPRAPTTNAERTESRVPTDYLQALNLNRVSDAYRAAATENCGSAYLYAQMLTNLYSGQHNSSIDILREQDADFETDEDGKRHNLNQKGHKKYSIIPEGKCKMGNSNKYGFHFYNSFSGQYSEMTVNIPKRIVCKVCQKVYPDTEKLRTHMHMHSKQKRFVCQSCNKCYTVYSSLWRHRKQHIKESMRKIRVINSKKGFLKHKNRYTCKFCSKSFTTPAMLSSHVVSHVPKKEFRCDICNKTFSCSRNVKRHKLLHKSVSVKTSTEPSKEKTVKKQTNKVTRIFSCKICKKTFPNGNALLCHAHVHTRKPDKFKCKFCSKVFCTTSGLLKHTKLQHASKRTVQKVSASERKQSSLKISASERKPSHLKVSSSERKRSGLKVSSSERKQSSFSTSARKQSSISLSERRPSSFSSSERRQSSLKCKFCSKTFTRREFLTKHVAAHRVNKRFVCDICGRKYSVLSSLKRHKKVHHNQSSRQDQKARTSRDAPKLQPKQKLDTTKVKKCDLCSRVLNSTNKQSSSKHGQCSHCSVKVNTAVPDSVKELSKPSPPTVKQIEKPVAKQVPLRQPVNEGKPSLDCKVCGKTFKDSSAYFSHLKSHPVTRESIFECPVCFRKYQQKSVMKRHVKSQHKSFPQDRL